MSLKGGTFKDSLISIYKKSGIWFSVILIIAIAAILSGFYIKSELLPKVYSGREFLSGYSKATEKTIDENSGFSGIFTYGPYINMDKGRYRISIYYSSNTDIRFDICNKSGQNIIYNGYLSAGGSRLDLTMDNQDEINDRSLEIRTYYDGKGSFTLKKVTIEPADKSVVPVIYIALFALAAAVCLLLFKNSRKIRELSIGYIGLHYILLYFDMGNNILLIFLTTLIAIMSAAILKLISEKAVIMVKGIKRPSEIICLLLSSYFIASSIFIMYNPESFDRIAFAANVTYPILILWVVAIFDIIMFLRLSVGSKGFSYLMLELSAVFLGYKFITGASGNDIYFTMGIVAVIGFITYYVFDKDRLNLSHIKIGDKAAFSIVILAFFVFCIFFGNVLVCKYKSFSSPTYDFGIFAQMFENMAKHGVQNTTVERGELLSHFAVHCSPIWYVFLPVYMIFRVPSTLLVCQVITVGAAVFPVFFLTKLKSRDNLVSIIISLAYLIMPAMVCPMFYDVHETCFLAVFILSIMYFAETRNWKWVYVFAALTLLVKEDSALYIAPIALYIIFSKKAYKQGALIFVISLIYFAAACALVNSSGKGVADIRYGVYCLPGEQGIMPMFKNIIRDPGFLLKIMFKEEMVQFIIYTFGVFMFIPLINRKYTNLLLLIPYLFMHLATDYIYQHDIGYQYTFGTCALVFFLFINNVCRFPKLKIYALAVTAFIACSFATYTYKGNLLMFVKYYNANKAEYDKSEQILKQIPDDAVIVVSDFAVGHIPQAEEMYVYPDDSISEPDYYVLMPKGIDNYNDLEANLLEKGYKEKESTSIIKVFEK